jgi:eukaryotic-like serine/threonine-protein kinase
MARARSRRRVGVAGPAGPPPPPGWRREIWPWLLALLLIVLGIIGGYVGYQAYQDDQDDQREVVTVTTTEPATTATDTTTGTTTGTTTATTTAETTTTVEEPPEPVTVPDVLGQGYVAAGSTIEGGGLVADSYPVASTETRGTVVAQRPAAGTQLKEGDTVRTNVALGTGPRRTRTVPDVTGPQASDARATLRTSGFTIRTQYRRPPSPEEEGEVLGQGPVPGTRARDLAQVTIFVGRS